MPTFKNEAVFGQESEKAAAAATSSQQQQQQEQQQQRHSPPSKLLYRRRRRQTWVRLHGLRVPYGHGERVQPLALVAVVRSVELSEDDREGGSLGEVARPGLGGLKVRGVQHEPLAGKRYLCKYLIVRACE